MVRRLIRNQLPRKGLRVRVPCPPLPWLARCRNMMQYPAIPGFFYVLLALLAGSCALLGALSAPPLIALESLSKFPYSSSNPPPNRFWRYRGLGGSSLGSSTISRRLTSMSISRARIGSSNCQTVIWEPLRVLRLDRADPTRLATALVTFRNAGPRLHPPSANAVFKC